MMRREFYHALSAIALGAAAGCSSLTQPPSPEPIASSVAPVADAAPAASKEAAQAPPPQPPAAPESLTMTTLKPGKGPGAKDGDRVSIHYVGTLTDGSKFDSSRDRKVPFEFVLGKGQVIKGWEQGISGMKVGEKRKLVIPPSLAYGPQGRPGIPPNSTLVFEVERMPPNPK